MNKAPKLRFKEFSGDWEINNLSNYTEKITRKNKDFLVTNVISNSAKNGLVSQRDFFDKDIANKNNIDGYYIIENGDFVYNPRKSLESPYGPINRYNIEDAGVVSPLYLCFKINKNINGKFLEYYFKSSKWYRFIYQNSDQGARHDRVSIKDSEFFKLNTKFPSLEEQEKIAYFFSLIDNKVFLQSEKLKVLKDYKTGMMQKIFSRELRFKDDEGRDYPEWEEKKFKEIIKQARLGGNYTNSESISSYPLIKMGNISRGNIDLSKIEYVNESETLNDEDILKEGDLLFNTRNTLDLVGKVAIWRNELDLAYYNSNLLRLVFKDEYVSCNYFMNYLFNSHDILSKLKAVATGTTSVAAIYMRDLENIKFDLPTKEEQDKIGKVLLKLDIKIQKEQAKLDYLNEYKKGLLQQIFV